MIAALIDINKQGLHADPAPIVPMPRTQAPTLDEMHMKNASCVNYSSAQTRYHGGPKISLFCPI
jgi:hypothetical protein